MGNHQSVIELLDCNRIPQLGLGVWQANPEEARAAVSAALKTGYRVMVWAQAFNTRTSLGKTCSSPQKSGMKTKAINGHSEQLTKALGAWNSTMWIC